MAREVFGGKIVDLQKSGLANMTIHELFDGRDTIAPTELVGAFWKKIREHEINDRVRYFGTKDEIGARLNDADIKALKSKH